MGHSVSTNAAPEREGVGRMRSPYEQLFHCGKLRSLLVKMALFSVQRWYEGKKGPKNCVPAQHQRRPPNIANVCNATFGKNIKGVRWVKVAKKLQPYYMNGPSNKVVVCSLSV